MIDVAIVVAGSPPSVKNAAWRATSSPWIVVVERDAPLPDLDALAPDPNIADVVSAPPPTSEQWPLLRAPFAVRRDFLEELDGFAELPRGLDDVDLGIRLWEARARFHAAPSWIATGDRLRKGSDPISPPLSEKGVGPHFAAASDDARLLFWRYPYTWILATSPPGDCVYSSGELGEYIAERSMPPLLPASDIARALEGARERGLYATGPAGEARFDRYQAENWILRNTPCREAQLGRTLLIRHPPPRMLGAADRLEVGIEGRYEVLLSADAVAGLERPTLSLPVPATCAELRDLELFDFDPPDLARHLEGTAILRFPLSSTQRVGYSFRCRVREGGPTPAGSDAPPRTTSLAPRYAAQLDEIIGSLFDGDTRAVPPETRARAIYRWVADAIPGYASDRPGLFALETRTGHCAHRTRLFALLCERVGLAVRERSGLTAGDIVSEDGRRTLTRFVNRGVALAHVWPEVLLDGAWWPVEFIGADHGRRVMTPSNIPTPAMRRRIRDCTPALDAYYFGTVDPYRVYFAAPPKGLTGAPVGDGNRDVAALRRALWATRQVLTMTVDGLPVLP